MNCLGRGLIGALFGALLTLFIHPYSRERLFVGPLSWGSPPKAMYQDLAMGRDSLPQPKSLADYSLWMEVGAQRIVLRQPTSSREWKNLLGASSRAARLEPDNAYWHQMGAVFLLAAQNRRLAQVRWTEASKRTRWDDGQTARLLAHNKRVTAAYGAGAWSLAAAYPRRSVASARTIELFARDVARNASLTSIDGLRLRYATLANGRLMRDGARAMQVLELGIAVVELASYPPNLTSINSPRKLLLARADLFNRLIAAKLTVQGEEADRAFRGNDAWLGYPNSAEAARDFEAQATLELIAVSIVPACLLATILGIGLWLAASSVEDSGWVERLCAPPWIVVIGVGLALGTFAATRSFLVSIAVAASAGFLGFGPSRARSRPGLELGPLHSLLLGLIGVIVLGSVGGMVAQFSLPGRELVDAIGYPDLALGGLGPILGIGIAGISMVSVISTFYAVVHHISTSKVFIRSVAQLGKTLAIGALGIAVLASPVALWADRAIAAEMMQRLTNEPVFYYLR